MSNPYMQSRLKEATFTPCIKSAIAEEDSYEICPFCSGMIKGNYFFATIETATYSICDKCTKAEMKRRKE